MSEKALVGAIFQIRLDPGSFGCEHRNPAIVAHDGAKCTLLAEVRPGLWRTDLVAEGPDSDFVHEGKLLVMPYKDGKIIQKKKAAKVKT